MSEWQIATRNKSVLLWPFEISRPGRYRYLMNVIPTVSVVLGAVGNGEPPWTTPRALHDNHRNEGNATTSPNTIR